MFLVIRYSVASIDFLGDGTAPFLMSFSSRICVQAFDLGIHWPGIFRGVKHWVLLASSDFKGGGGTLSLIFFLLSLQMQSILIRGSMSL